MGKERGPEQIARLAARGWGIRAYAVTPVRAAYRVAGAEGLVALKSSRKPEERLRLLNQADRHLEANGFYKTAPLLPTLTGEPFLRWGGELWTASPWREGREPEYRLTGDLTRCAETLAEFHRASLGFRPAGVSLRNDLRRRPARLKRRVAELKRRLAQVGGASPADAFAVTLRRLAPAMVRQAELAEALLERSGYVDRCAWAEEARPLCHGDASNRNFVLGADGVAYLLDLESLKLDLPEIDLYRLLRRALNHAGWRFDTARETLAAYSRFTPLEASARAVILALLCFPDQAASLAEEYGTGEAPAERLAPKLRRLEEEWPARQAFLRSFARTCELQT